MNVMERYSILKVNKEAAEDHYNFLLEKRAELWVKYCGVKSVPTDKELQKSGYRNNSNVVSFLFAYEERKGESGKSLAEEIAAAKKELHDYKKTLNQISRTLKELSARSKFGKTKDKIIYELYTKIMVDGLGPTQAVREVTEEYEFANESAIWRTYYPIVKKYMTTGKRR